ncbi:hypothetical protein M431DRAFT_534519 [Trichoderma harzianum CBS 226.95]|uniref:Uncharacterized protein n=1 Tax=Trichoderma harzianum CBS 226.95 TaxID=983964 RepID=A0A2T3ZYH7_TRIHA|nr:hypothetical protein M431DRAFT_534519 [Trichoderma harzianum CBS 226.95]PTB49793.1 hypothetical protein M431DRAFT_534519 [Trichoderma harzianum CBS 226.95]
MSKHSYCEEKIDLIEQGKLAPNGPSQKKVYEGRDFGKRTTRSGASGYQDDWKKRRDQDQKGGFREAAEVVVSVVEVVLAVSLTKVAITPISRIRCEAPYRVDSRRGYAEKGDGRGGKNQLPRAHDHNLNGYEFSTSNYVC